MTRTIMAGAALAALSVCAAPPAGARVVDVTADATCGVDADQTEGVRRALADAAGGLLVVPAGCWLRLGSPGAGRASLTVPTRTEIRCEPGAGFVLTARACGGGRYPGAACGADDDCPEGGPGSCRGTPFAPQAEAAYTVLDAAEGSTEVGVRGCALRIAGADDYARCVDGPHAGRPCESWCNAGPLRNVTCGSDEYCAPGVCLHAEDCPGMSCLAGPHAARACDGAHDCPAGQCTKGGCVGGARDGQRCDCPGSTCGANCRGESGAPSGPGGIDVVDFGRASHAVIDGVRLFDHRRGALSFAVGDDGLLRDADNTRTMRAEFDPLFTAGPRVAVTTGARVGAGSIIEASGLRGTRTGLDGVDRGNIRVSHSTVTQESEGFGPAAAIDVGSNVLGSLNATVEFNTVRATGIGATGVYLRGQQHRVVGNQVLAWYCIRGDPLSVTNASVTDNRCLGGPGAKVTITGAGWQVANNYLAWGSGHGGRCAAGARRREACRVDLDCAGGSCGERTCAGGTRAGLACDCPRSTCIPDPVVLIGTDDAIGQGEGHAIVSGNIIFSDVPHASLVRFADVGARCARGDAAGRACAANADCPGSACQPEGHSDGLLAGNNLYAAPPGQVGIDLGGLTAPTFVRSWAIVGNVISGVGTDVAIRLPADATRVTDLQVSGNDLGGRWRCSGGTNAGTVCDRHTVPTGCLGGGRCDLHDTSGAHIENWSWDAGTLIGNTPVAPGDDHVDLAWLVNRGPAPSEPGDAVAAARAADGGFVPAEAADARPLGVVLDAVAPGGVAQIAVSGTTRCNVAAAVARGDALRPSPTPGKLEATADANAPAAAIALSASAGPGRVRCLVRR
jgi:hypothetical protein